jgi:WD40 repeat protein
MRTCPSCGRAFPEKALDGICPSCSLRQALGDVAGSPELPAAEPSAPDALGSSLITHHSSLDPSGHFGDYELLEEIGRGGMGVVFKARQESLDRIVAVKMLLPGATSHPDYLNRFRTEASAAAGLQHPNIVAIHEVGVHEGRPYLVMDFVEGRSLARVISDLKSQISDYRQAARWMQTVAEAIQFAHDHGILHRDLKPSNILIDASGQPRLTDFGLAKRLAGDTSLTLSGQLLGSPSYMPPEQAAARHGKVSRRSDVYGLGATLYHLLTGRAPFQAATITETLDEVLNKEPVAPRVLSSGIPRDLETICLKCLEKDPHRRYASARELADELGRFLRGEPTLARPIGFVGKAAKWCRRRPAQATLLGALAIVFLLGSVGVLWQWRQSEGQRRRAEAQRLRAEAGERLAAQRAYDSDMNLAQRALAEFNLGHARGLLDRHRPPPSDKWRVTSDKRGLVTDHSSPTTPLATRHSSLVTDLRGWEWRYLWKQSRGTGSEILMTSTNPICALALSADGQWLAVREWHPAAGAFPSDRITLWDLPARRRVGEVRSKGWHRALAISTSLNLLAAPEFERSGSDQTLPVRLWDLTTLKEVGRLPHPEGINCLALSPDGRQLATHANDEQLHLWDLAAQREIKPFPASKAQEPTWFLGGLLFSPDGNRLVFGDSRSRSNRLIDLRTDQELTLTPPVGEGDAIDGVSAMALSPDGRRLAIGYGFSTSPIYVWDLEAGTWLHKLAGHHAFVDSLAFTPDGRTLASAGSDQTIRLWNVDSGRCTQILMGHTEMVVALAAIPDGRGLVSASADGTVRIWNLERLETNTEPVTLPVRYQPFLTPFAFLPDSRSFLSLDLDGAAVIRNAVTGAAEERLTALGTNHNAVGISPDGRWVVVGGLAQHLGVWDRWQRLIVTNTTVQTGDVWAVSFDARGLVLRVTASLDSGRATVRLIDTRDWREVQSWNVERWQWFELAWSPDDRLAALGAMDGTVRWWDAATGRELEVTQGPSADATSVAFSPDSRWLAAASWMDGRVILWDATSRRVQLPTLRAHLQVAVGVTFSPDGRRLITGGMLAEEGVRIWDFGTRSELLTLPAPLGFVQNLALSPDGNTLIGLSAGATAGFSLYLWHVPSWEEITAAESAR